ncbi:MAG: FmdB family zinc ribbon protein [Phycisphaerae bacterium]
MPTYEYECDGCGHEFEEFQSITSDALKTCPKCRKNKLRRLIGAGAGLIFRGSGFYLTDYRSESYRQGAEAEKKAAEPKGESAAADSKRDTSKQGAEKSVESKPGAAERPVAKPAATESTTPAPGHTADAEPAKPRKAGATSSRGGASRGSSTTPAARSKSRAGAKKPR